METYGGVEEQIRVLLSSVLVGGERRASSPGRFTPAGPRPRLHNVDM
jgi:hypothetical protein